MRSLVVVLLTLLSVSAHARALLGPSVRVALEGHREAGIGLRGTALGWRLRLDRAADAATSVVFVDQTAPSRDKWIIGGTALTPGSILLDGARFRGGHAYRVEVWRGITLVERGLVYLYPTQKGRPSHVRFDAGDDDTSPFDDTPRDAMAVIPKSAL